MNILYVTTVGSTMGFFKQFINELIKEGHTVDIACNDHISDVPACYKQWGCKVHHLSCIRTPLTLKTITAIQELKKITSSNHYDIIHCHTPIAAMCTRIACRKTRKSGTKIIYTAHGFHFYKGAPLKSWMLYYPIEKICSHWTDTLITINQEDYLLAKKKMKAHSVEYIPGMGVDTKKIANTEVCKSKKRLEIGVPQNAFLLLSVGELNCNKNHEVVIRAIAQLQNHNIYYAIAGYGDHHNYLKLLADELGIAEQIHFLGYRKDVAELYATSDVCCFPSIREGLGLAAIEGMAAGLPLLVADNRGTRDYCNHLKNGLVCDPFSPTEFANAIQYLADNKDQCQSMGQLNAKSVEIFDIQNITQKMHAIYDDTCSK